MNNSSGRILLGETIGTFILVFLGCGAVHAAVLTGAQAGLWQVAVVWGVAIMMAGHVAGDLSGSHINPAITAAMAAWRKLPLTLVPVYFAGQILGASLAAAALYALFGAHLSQFEAQKGIVRGEAGSEMSAMCYGTYFPNPGRLAAGDLQYSAAEHEQLRSLVSFRTAFFAEFLGTFLLGLTVFAMTDPKNRSAPGGPRNPYLIGLTVAALISVIAPLTQACFNPARALGPRLVAYAAGWGSIALPGIQDGSWMIVYLIAPTAGAVTAGGLYRLWAISPPSADEC
ncbi:MAG: MIP/aquaporin family protein [Planctomyces sp.]